MMAWTGDSEEQSDAQNMPSMQGCSKRFYLTPFRCLDGIKNTG